MHVRLYLHVFLGIVIENRCEISLISVSFQVVHILNLDKVLVDGSKKERGRKKGWKRGRERAVSRRMVE